MLAVLACLPIGVLPAVAGDQGKGKDKGNGQAKRAAPTPAPAPAPAEPAAPSARPRPAKTKGSAHAPGASRGKGARQRGARVVSDAPEGGVPAPAPGAEAPRSAGARKHRGAAPGTAAGPEHRAAGPKASRKAGQRGRRSPAADVATPAVAAPGPGAALPVTAGAPPARAGGPRPDPAPRRRAGAPRRPAGQRRAAARRRAPDRGSSAAARPAAVMAPSRWVPAGSVTGEADAAPASAPAAAPPSREGPRRPAGQEPEPDGTVPVIPVVLNALAESVAFVPTAVWAALGGLVLLALLLAALAWARHRRAVALTREREDLIADIAALEGAVLPDLPEALGGLALSVTSSPGLGAMTGGDFHDAFPLSGDRVAVLVGDVAGHGRPALADAQLVRHAVRAYLEAGLDPRAAIAMTGAVVEERQEPLWATVVAAVHDRRDGTLTFASAGHEPPILVSEQGAGLPPVSGWSPPLGAGLETGRRQTSIPLPRGSAVCLITGGVTEARSMGERLGASRVITWLSALGPGTTSSDVVARLREEADTGDEDVTVCMLRALTPAARDVPRIEEAVVESGDPSYLVRFLRDCGLPLADAEEAGEVLEAAPDGTRMIASVEVRGGRAVVELAPLRAAQVELIS